MNNSTNREMAGLVFDKPTVGIVKYDIDMAHFKGITQKYNKTPSYKMFLTILQFFLVKW